MKEKLRRSLRLLFVLAFLISTALLIRQRQEKAGGAELYAAARELAAATEAAETEPETPEPETAAPAQKIWVPAPVAEEDPVMEELAALDLAALKEINPDVLGWIHIPQSQVDYPLLQGTDNDFYLSHTWEGKSNAVGSIFLEYQNSPHLTDFNTIVYGHNMNDGSMFASLRSYAQEGYWEARPYVYVATEAGVYRYEVFSAYRADVDSEVYGLSFLLEKTKASFLLYALEHCQIGTGVLPEITDRVLTLSTCSGAGYTNRWVVHARLKMIQTEA